MALSAELDRLRRDLVAELEHALRPLLRASRHPIALYRFLRQVGWEPSGEINFAEMHTALTDTINAVLAANTDDELRSAPSRASSESSSGVSRWAWTGW